MHKIQLTETELMECHSHLSNEKLLSLIVIRYTWWCFRYALQTDNLLKYIKIAAQLQDKTVRDVALRCRWMTVSGLITP
jgi:hypothetical protein